MATGPEGSQHTAGLVSENEADQPPLLEPQEPLSSAAESRKLLAALRRRRRASQSSLPPQANHRAGRRPRGSAVLRPQPLGSSGETRSKTKLVRGLHGNLVDVLQTYLHFVK